MESCAPPLEFTLHVPTLHGAPKILNRQFIICTPNNQFKSWSRSCTGLHYVQAKVLGCHFQALSCKLRRKELAVHARATSVNRGLSHIKACLARLEARSKSARKEIEVWAFYSRKYGIPPSLTFTIPFPCPSKFLKLT